MKDCGGNQKGGKRGQGWQLGSEYNQNMLYTCVEMLLCTINLKKINKKYAHRIISEVYNEKSVCVMGE
jgi:hypothetical protein